MNAKQEKIFSTILQIAKEYKNPLEVYISIAKIEVESSQQISILELDEMEKNGWINIQKGEIFYIGITCRGYINYQNKNRFTKFNENSVTIQ